MRGIICHLTSTTYMVDGLRNCLLIHSAQLGVPLVVYTDLGSQLTSFLKAICKEKLEVLKESFPHEEVNHNGMLKVNNGQKSGDTDKVLQVLRDYNLGLNEKMENNLLRIGAHENIEISFAPKCCPNQNILAELGVKFIKKELPVIFLENGKGTLPNLNFESANVQIQSAMFRANS